MKGLYFDKGEEIEFFVWYRSKWLSNLKFRMDKSVVLFLQIDSVTGADCKFLGVVGFVSVGIWGSDGVPNCDVDGFRTPTHLMTV